MANNRDGEIIVGIDIPASQKIMEEDAKKALAQIKDLKVMIDRLELDDKAASNLQAQIDKIKNLTLNLSNIEINQGQVSKAGQQIGKNLGGQTGKNLGDSINKELTSGLNTVKQNIENVLKSFSSQRLNSANLMKMFNIDASKVDSSVIQQIRSLTNEINTLGKEMVKTGSGAWIDNILDKIASLGQVLKQFGSGRDLTQFKESLDVLDYFKGKKIFVSEASEALVNTGMGVRELNNQFRNLGVTFTTVTQNSLKLDSVWSELFNISPGLEKVSSFGDQINAVVEHLKTAKEALYGDKNLTPVNYEDVYEVLMKYVDNLEEAERKVSMLKEQEAELKHIMEETTISADAKNIKNSVAELEREASAMKDVEDSADKAATEKLEFADANRRVADSAESTSRAVEQEHDAMQSLDDIGYILQNISMQGQAGNGVFQQFGNTLRNAFYVFTAANLLQDAIHKVINSGKEAVGTVKELNDATTALRMATGDSYSSIKQLMSDYNIMAQELGANTISVSEAADAWLRQGHNIEDTNTLIKDSMMLSKVSELEAADSTKYLTSAMQGYKVAVEDVEKVVDKLSAVDLESATDAGGLAEAMSRTAESAQIAGISMDRLLGMIAATGEVTQKSMSSIGESYKTIFARMRDIKDNKLSVVGDDGEVEDLSNVEIVLEQLGIKLRDSNLEFRNFQEVLDDVAGSWDSFSSVQQAAISKAFAGQRQAENFLVMMENWDKVLKYTDVAANSEGTASEKFGYYLESLEAKTQSLKASLENLASTTISDELYGSVLDTTKAMVDMTAQSGILKGALAGLGTVGAIYAFQQLTGYLHSAAQEFSNFGNAINMVKGGQVGINDMQNLINLTGNLTQSQTRLLLSTDNLTDAQKVAILMNQRVAQGLPPITQAEALQQLQTMGLATSQGVLTASTLTLKSALQGLWASLTANPLILVAMAVTAGVTAWNKYKQSQEEARQASLDAGRAARDEAQSIIELYNAYSDADLAYKSNTGSKEALEGATDSLLSALGLEQSEIENLIQKYGSLDKAIRGVTTESLKKELADLTSGYNTAKDDLVKAAKGKLFPAIQHSNDEQTLKYIDVLKSAGLIDDDFRGTNGSVFYAGDNSSLEGIVEMYENLQKMRDVLQSKVGELYTQEELSESDLYNGISEKINAFSEQYEAYIGYVDDINKTTAQIQYNEYIDGSGIPETQKQYENLRKTLVDTAIASGKFVGSQKQIEDSVVNALSEIPELTTYIDGYNQALEASSQGNSESITPSISDKFNDLWDSDGFKDAKEDLVKLAKESKVSASDIKDLAKENAELAELLEETGMSAQFAAKCFDTMCRGGNGFDAITSDALLLDNVLNGMTDSLKQATNAKSKYDEAMSKDDYNKDFKNYQEAYSVAMEMFENGEFGRHFRDTMEYLLGTDSYTMSIEELEAACKNLKSVFGDNATNGFEFLDKLYANKDILDDLDSSLTKLSDGSYDFDLKPEEFEQIADALGMTTEGVTACVNALGMFGDYSSYDLEELELAMNAISIAAHDDEKAITSLQGVTNILQDLGYSGYDVAKILQDIQGMGTVQLIDFDGGNIDSIISQLKDLEMIKVDGNNIDLDSLITGMQQLGNTDVDITSFIDRLNGQFNLTDAQGQLVDFESAKEKALSSTENGASDDVAKVGEEADSSAESVQSLGNEIDNVNKKSLSSVQLQFVNVSTAATNAKDKVQSIIDKINTLNGTKISVNTSGGASGTDSKKGYHGTVGNAFADGTFDGYKDLPITGYKGLPNDEKNALRSEYGQPELTVYPNGKTELTTQPTMSDLPRGTVIFNGEQTKKILNGNGDSSGKAYASGTAKKRVSSSSSDNSSNKNKGDNDSNTKKTKNLIDWIEKRINYFSRKTENWLNRAETSTTNLVDKLYKHAKSSMSSLMTTYSKGYDRYMKQANKVTGLTSKEKKLVREGKIDITNVSDKKAEAISEYEQW